MGQGKPERKGRSWAATEICVVRYFAERMVKFPLFLLRGLQWGGASSRTTRGSRRLLACENDARGISSGPEHCMGLTPRPRSAWNARKRSSLPGKAAKAQHGNARLACSHWKGNKNKKHHGLFFFAAIRDHHLAIWLPPDREAIYDRSTTPARHFLAKLCLPGNNRPWHSPRNFPPRLVQDRPAFIRVREH